MGNINELIKTVEGKCGAGRIGFAGKLLKPDQLTYIDIPRLPTGVFAVDYALAGGLPLNTPTQFYGPNNGGKSTLAILLAKSLSRFCMNSRCLRPAALCKCPKPIIKKTFLCFTEGMPPDTTWLRTLNYDYRKEMVIGVPDYGEMACEMIEAALKNDECGLVIVDSLAGIMPKAEMDGSYLDCQVAAQPRLVSKLFRRTASVLVNEFRRGHMVAIVFLNQIRAVIGGGTYGPSESTPGGYAAKHGYRLSMRISQLVGDAKTGEVDKEDHVKNVLKFAASMLGPNSKQQLLLLAGKTEYKLAVRDYKGYTAGTSMDAGIWIQMALEQRLLTKLTLSKGYRLEGTKITFDKPTEIEDIFKTGQYKGRDGFDDILKGMVIKRSREQFISTLEARDNKKVKVVTAPVQSIAEEEE